MTEGMLGRNNETMRAKGWRTDEGERTDDRMVPGGTVLTLLMAGLKRQQRHQNPEIWVAFGTASTTSPTLRGAPSDRGGHLHLGLMLGQLRVEK